MGDLNLLKVFEIVITKKSISAAAKELGVSSPAVSQAIGRLKQKYNDPLFVKEGRNLIPTNFAYRLYEKIKEPLSILSTIDDFEKDFIPETSKETFKIATNSDYDLLFFGNLLKIIEKEAPNINIKIITYNDENEETLEEHLRLRKVDCVVSTMKPKDKSLLSKKVFEEEIVGVANKNHRIFDKEITLKSILNEKHVVYQQKRNKNFFLESITSNELQDRKIEYTTYSVFNLMLTCKKTNMIGLTGKSFYNELKEIEGLKTFNLPFKIENLPLYSIYHKATIKEDRIIWLDSKIKQAFTKKAE